MAGIILQSAFELCLQHTMQVNQKPGRTTLMAKQQDGRPNRKHRPKNPVGAVRQPVQSDGTSRYSSAGRAKTYRAPSNTKGEVDKRRITVWTVGHSTRPVSDFIALLQAQRIDQLVDVRTVPRSRHNPQFNQDQLSESLKEVGIHYLHIAGLGGLRRARRDSINTAWKNASFRGYADYMQTSEFGVALNELINLARDRRTAIMCAEAVPWRCHRSLIGDALLVHGIDVKEIASETRTRPHMLTPWSCVVGERLTYPSVQIDSDAKGGEIGIQDRPIKS
jgi:hypothetical protein